MRIEILVAGILVAAAIWGFAAGINRIDLEKVGTVQTERFERIDAIR